MSGLSKPTVLTKSDTFTRQDPAVYFAVNCTVAGDVKVELGGGTYVITVAVGSSFFPLGVIGVYSTGTTATATYANFYR
jgi:hypothetical protein